MLQRADRPLPAVEVGVVDDEPGVCALRDEWNALADAMDPPSPFNSWEWATTWWAHLGPAARGHRGCSLEVVTMRDRGRLIGLAPFYRRRLGHRRLGATMLLPLGWEPGRGWSVTEGLEFLFANRERRRLLDALSSWLEGARFGFAVLPGLHEGDALTPWLSAHAASRGSMTPYLYRHLEPSWDALVAGLNKSLRDNVRYYPRLLRRRGHDVGFTVASSAGDVAASLPVLFALHRARALAPMRVRHHDQFGCAERRAFFGAVAPALAALGRLKIGVLHVDGEPVAAQMWLENGDTLFLYYSGHAPQWSRFSVALVATIETLRAAIDAGLGRVEFLAGGGHFKERWDPQRRSRHNLTLAARPRLLRSVFALPSVRDVARRLS